MNIRKEQGLFVVVLLLGVWAWSGMWTTEPRKRNVVTNEREYTPVVAPGIPLVEPLAEAKADFGAGQAAVVAP